MIIYILIILIIFLLFLYNKKENKETIPCICVFDLDKTITCGLDQAKNAIKECRQNSCKFAFNTARPQPYYDDIKFSELTLNKDEIENDVYHGNNYDMHKISYINLVNEIANKKVENLNIIHKKYNVPKKKIILFDDVIENIQHAQKHGYSVIHANHPVCGLNQHVKSNIKDILNKY